MKYDPTATPRRGSVRHKDPAGEYYVSAPGDLLYSTALMCAQEFWDGEKWRDIDDSFTEF